MATIVHPSIKWRPSNISKKFHHLIPHFAEEFKRVLPNYGPRSSVYHNDDFVLIAAYRQYHHSFIIIPTDLSFMAVYDIPKERIDPTHVFSFPYHLFEDLFDSLNHNIYLNPKDSIPNYFNILPFPEDQRFNFVFRQFIA